MFHNETHIHSIAGSVKRGVDGRLRPLLMASAACGLFVGTVVSAAEYTVQPSVNARLTSTDNLLLGVDGREIETILLEVKPRVRIRRSTEKWQAAIDASVTAERLEDDDFDSDNQNVSFQLTRQAETVQYQFVALNDRSNTRVTELDELGIQGFNVERRDRQYVRPGVTWTLNPKNRLAFGVSGENVHYGGFNFSDYDYYSADIAWTHQYSEKTRLEFSTFGSEYSAVSAVSRNNIYEVCDPTFVVVPNVGIDIVRVGSVEEFGSETVGVQIGGSRQPTSRLSYRGSFGYRNITNRNQVRCVANGLTESSGSSDGFILDTGVSYQGEKYGLDMSFSRSVSPAGLGFLTERDNFQMNVSYRYSEHLTGTFLINGFNTENLDGDFDFKQEGFRVTPGVSWRFNEKLNLIGGVIYRSAESLNVAGKREGLSAYAGFNYNFKPIRFNR